jgi:diacylglycerol kinase
MKIKKFFKGFTYASNGIKTAFKSELNLKFHFLVAIVVLIFSFWAKISLTDFFIILLLFAIVMASELFNTCIEGICNILRDKYKLPYEGSRDIRDMAAGAVLINALIATIIGILVFAKYL